jgi:NIMA (never in mitosis gene a)-related kinase
MVKIGDLGVAKLLQDNADFAQTMVGTPFYLSPELC